MSRNADTLSPLRVGGLTDSTGSGQDWLINPREPFSSSWISFVPLFRLVLILCDMNQAQSLSVDEKTDARNAGDGPFHHGEVASGRLEK